MFILVNTKVSVKFHVLYSVTFLTGKITLILQIKSEFDIHERDLFLSQTKEEFFFFFFSFQKRIKYQHFKDSNFLMTKKKKNSNFFIKKLQI